MSVASPWADLQSELDTRAAQGLLRRRRVVDGVQQPQLIVDGQSVLAFCSNDYLGLAGHPALVQAMQAGSDVAGIGSGASHLISGHHRLHHELEEALAHHVQLPRALLFSTGYMANLGVIAALMGRDDAVFSDRLNHASLNDATVLSRVRLQRYAHNDLQQLESLLAASRARRKLVVADAVFSMDGDLAPVPQLLALCEQYDAWLLLDDAHGFGVLGERGRGILEHFAVRSPRIVYMATLGKAAGVFGAFVAGEPELVEYLMQTARTHIYTTAMPPALAAALLAALPIIAEEAWRRRHLADLVAMLKRGLRSSRWSLIPSDTPIQPLLIGGNEETLAVSSYLQQQGVLVPAIRPPTVPKGSARLRITLSASHQETDIRRLLEVLEQAERAVSA